MISFGKGEVSILTMTMNRVYIKEKGEKKEKMRLPVLVPLVETESEFQKWY